MTIAQCTANLFGHFAPEERSIPDAALYPGRNAAILEALNGALQECFGNASPWVRWDERGAVLRPPASVTVSVTNGSTAATVSAGWEAWMAGCSIVIDGHDIDNQLRAASSTNVLKVPYDGATGSKGAMVYQDCVAAASDVLAIYGPVRAHGLDILPRPSADVHGRSQEDYGAHLEILTVPVLRQRVSLAAGQPLAYWVETWSAGDTAAPAVRLRLGPANSRAGVLEYRVMLKPPAITSISSTNALPVPFEFVQTIFLPIARQKLTGSPFFRSGGFEEISRAYREAIDLLTKLKPSKDDGITLRPRF